jgi:DNA-binding response OmpR family regulator
MKRIILVATDANERALIAAQLQEELPCTVASAADAEEARALLTLRADLVIVDWRGLDAPDVERLRAAARGARLLVLASRVDHARMAPRDRVLYRPFTIGQVVARARKILEEKSEDG